MNNRRSQTITRGVERTPNRAMLRAVGFDDADFDKPIVGVANGYSTITPCNIGLNTLAERAIDSLRKAGTMPQVFGTITVSDGISMGTEGMKYSLVSREVIADSIETVCRWSDRHRRLRQEYAGRDDSYRAPQHSVNLCLRRHD
jgi:dihydroxy-acid dehydratase